MCRDEEGLGVLDRIAVIRYSCDLDLLIFFVQHPSTLLTSEQLAAFVGYELTHISASLDTLIGARLLRRTQHPTHAARLYEFTPGESTGDWLPSLIRLASTREGRLALREALRSERATETNRGTSDSAAEASPPRSACIDERRTGDKRHA
jgi:hypothetical protein